MNILQVIQSRVSTRKYNPKPVEASQIQELRDYISTVRKLFADIDMDTHIIEDGEGFQEIIKGLIGSYGKIKAPHYLIATTEKKEGYAENVGFAVEQVVLKLTDMGIATCWIGGSVGSINRKRLGEMTTLKDSHIPLIIVSFGYPETPIQLPPKRKRMEISEFVTGDIPPKWQPILEAVRIAPSAVNLQPWRIRMDKKGMDMYVIKNILFIKNPLAHFSRHDAGIALAHVYLAAQHFGMTVEFVRRTGKEVGKFEYVISAVEKK